MPRTRILDVRLYGRRIGQLRERTDGRVELNLDTWYVEDPTHDVLGQVFEDDRRTSFVERHPHGPLPRFFGHMLPEGMLRAYLLDESGVDAADSMGLLRHVGRDLPGAVTVEDPDQESASTDASPTGDEPRRDRHGAEGRLEKSADRRFSLAGMQMKFTVVKNQATLNLPGRNETGDWILEPPSATYAGLAENEWSMLEWARVAGFEVPACRLTHRQGDRREIRRAGRRRPCRGGRALPGSAHEPARCLASEQHFLAAPRRASDDPAPALGRGPVLAAIGPLE